MIFGAALRRALRRRRGRRRSQGEENGYGNRQLASNPRSPAFQPILSEDDTTASDNPRRNRGLRCFPTTGSSRADGRVIGNSFPRAQEVLTMMSENEVRKLIIAKLELVGAVGVH